MRVSSRLTESILGENIYGSQTPEEWLAHIEAGVKAPYVKGYVSRLGGPEKASVMFSVSLDPKSEWHNGIMQNSRYLNMALHGDGEFYQVSGMRPPFRKTRVKSAEDAVAKLNKYLASVSK